MTARLSGAWRVLRGARHASPPRLAAYIPPSSPLADEQGASARREAALSMMDPDCYGFLLIAVHRERVGVGAEIRLSQHVDRSWWPAICETLEAIVDEARSLR